MQLAKASHPPLVSVISQGRAISGKELLCCEKCWQLRLFCPLLQRKCWWKRISKRREKSGVDVYISSPFLWGNKSICTSHFVFHNSFIKWINLWSIRAIFLLHGTVWPKYIIYKDLLINTNDSVITLPALESFSFLYFQMVTDERIVSLKYVVLLLTGLL